MSFTLIDRIFTDSAAPAGFDALALEVFRYQAEHCEPYGRYIDLLGIDPSAVTGLREIPYLPVEFFKTHRIYSACSPEHEEPELNSELYGPKSQIHIFKGLLRLWDPRQFQGAYEVVCCEKQNGIWYVRLQLVEENEVSEAMYLDLAIDSWTGEVNYRRGFADQLRLNWRAIVDGEVTGSSDEAVLKDKAGKK